VLTQGMNGVMVCCTGVKIAKRDLIYNVGLLLPRIDTLSISRFESTVGLCDPNRQTDSHVSPRRALTALRVPCSHVQRVRMMGGSVDRSLNSDVTHLIATGWGSRKCEVATELGKPVMTEAWIEHVWKKSATQLCSGLEFAIIKAHRLSVFHGVIVSVRRPGLQQYCAIYATPQSSHLL
jgi:hypothetical protein